MIINEWLTTVAIKPVILTMGVGFTLRVLSMIERAGRNYLWIPATLRTDSGGLVEHEGRDAGLQDSIEVEESRVYVKLKLDENEAKCISFHD